MSGLELERGGADVVQDLVWTLDTGLFEGVGESFLGLGAQLPRTLLAAQPEREAFPQARLRVRLRHAAGSQFHQSPDQFLTRDHATHFAGLIANQGMSEHRLADCVGMLFQIWIDLDKDGFDSGEQVFAPPIAQVQYALSQHRHGHAYQEHDHRQADEHVECLEHFTSFRYDRSRDIGPWPAAPHVAGPVSPISDIKLVL